MLPSHKYVDWFFMRQCEELNYEFKYKNDLEDEFYNNKKNDF